MPEVTLDGSGDVLTSSVIGFFRSSKGARVTGTASAGMFSFSSMLKSSFFAGESLTWRFCRLEAACKVESLV